MLSFTPYAIPSRDFIINCKMLKTLRRLTFPIHEFRSEIEGFADIKSFLVLLSSNFLSVLLLKL